MARSILLALDCSTTASKAIAVDADGTVIAETRQPHTTSTPAPGWYEQNPWQWWEASADALAAVAAMLSSDDEVLALALTNQRETFACLDASGAPLRPALLWLDARATDQIARLGSARVHRLTGKPPSSAPSSYKLAWLAENEPETLARARTVTDVQGFLALRLTGERRTSSASADSTGLLDIVSGAWDLGLARDVMLDPELLPELAAPGDVLGLVSRDAATRTSLPVGLPVVAGLGDGQAGMVGTGALQDGRAALNAGTSFALGIATGRYSWDPSYRTFAGPVHSSYVLESLTAAGGLSLAWFREHVARGASIDQVERAASEVPAVRHGALFLPYLTGTDSPRRDPLARGAFVGLGTEHGVGAMYRAVVEGLALEQRRGLARLEEAIGHGVEEVVMTGGLAQSPLVVQTVADALGRPVSVARERESTALGAAVVAAAGPPVGLYPNLADAVGAMTGTRSTVEPDPATRTLYDEAAAVHAELRPALAPLGAALSRLRGRGGAQEPSGVHPPVAQIP
ncbi:xylulokinase [Phycicoccus endophyticus]|uniref:xylulokinase n=1 Tax=Phycicoccus endophyticus TaxID=1690220 RepID=UPI00140C8022|nr:FGGY family carbohydrate kinase [Phycicoccus endophyticus]NHI19614.1 carbohydrate kinase [Phycicoccus endophyticus]GGL34500.1 xylulokinase [Phycicoccus endophyticus]